MRERERERKKREAGSPRVSRCAKICIHVHDLIRLRLGNGLKFTHFIRNSKGPGFHFDVCAFLLVFSLSSSLAPGSFSLPTIIECRRY